MSYLFRGMFIAFLCLSVIACEKEDLKQNNSVVDVPMEYDAIELEISKLVNKHRADKGLLELTILNLISVEAESHSLYMLEHEAISHDNFNDRAKNLIDNADAKNIAENVAFGYDSAESLLNGWLQSPEHCENIESKHFTNFGISVKRTERGSYYVTQIYIESY